MEKFSSFINHYYPDYNLINITSKVNSRNINQYSNTINQNPKNIYFIEKNANNLNIFRDMKYPKHKYMFLNLDKVFLMEHEDEINKETFDIYINKIII